MPNLHPMVVHFPIALLTMSFLCDLLARFSDNGDHRKFGWWLQVAGTIGLAAAVTTGLFARDTAANLKSAGDYFAVHEQLAFIVSGAYALLAYWRIASRRQIPARYETLYLLLTGGSILLLWTGAWYGGEMVYTFGVGVRP